VRARSTARVPVTGRRTPRQPSVGGTAGRHAALVQLQQTAGNAAVTALIEGRTPTIQGHYVPGLHTAHPVPPKKPQTHTKEEATRASARAVELAGESKDLLATAEDPKSSARAAATALVRITEIQKIVASQLTVVDTCTDAVAKGALMPATRIARDRVIGAQVRAGSTEESKAKSEHEQKVKLGALSPLLRAEAAAVDAAHAANQALAATTTTAAGAALAAAGKALEQVRLFKGRLDVLAAEVTRFPAVVALMKPYTDAGMVAATLAERMVVAATDRRDALKRVDERKAARALANEKATKELLEAEGQLPLADDVIDEIQHYRDQFVIDMPRFDDPAVGGQLVRITAELEDAHQRRVDAIAYRDQCIADKAATALTGDTEVADAEAAAGEARRLAETAPDSPAIAAADLSLLSEARSLAGSAAALTKFAALIPDRAELVRLLRAVGTSVGREWLESANIGVARTKAILATLGEAGLTSLVKDVGPKVDLLLVSLTAGRIADLYAQVGGAELQTLLDSFSATELNGLASELGAPQLRALLLELPASTLKALGLTPQTLKGALAQVPAVTVKALIDEVGVPRVKDYFTTLTAIQVRDLLPHVPAATLKSLDFTGAKLRDLLTAVTAERLAAIATGLGTTTIKAVVAAFTPTEVEALATEFGLAPLKALLEAVPAALLKVLDLAAPVLKAALAEVPAATLKALIDAIGALRVKDYYHVVTPTRVKDLLPSLPADALKRLDLTGADLDDLLSEYTGTELAGLMTDLGDAALKDLRTRFTAAEVKAYRTTVGDARFQELIVDKKLKAGALHHYGPAFLETFDGAGPATMHHLVTATFNSAGQVSGGHDEAVFTNFINRRYPPVLTVPPVVPTPPGQLYGRITANPGAAAVYRVEYETYFTNGAVRNTGSKTLIQNLATQQATWKGRFNQAIWDAIRRQAFGVGNFAGQADDTTRYGGYYTAGDQVDTVYPL